MKNSKIISIYIFISDRQFERPIILSVHWDKPVPTPYNRQYVHPLDVATFVP